MSSLFVLPAQAAELRITVEGIRSQSGTILIGLYDSLATFNRAIAMSDREGFLNDPSRFAAVALRANAALKSSVVFTNLNPGRYAIVLFHDEDGNGKLNKDALGVPTEPYGFSNDARGFLGPPAFEKAIMQIDDSDKVVRITLTRPDSGPMDDKSKRR
ncbi:DUF2141 domain-containing protein [Azospirillum argentinense]|uniref:DUF2141 domain-containing protein n=1 Tax=Azospirillum argentinense TaxID=2970906 RepID=UPI001FFE4E18|nr:DUF2141 domain-containing protein [Azospirillum argentinense]